ncbi:transmembrane amino acid transporter protein-domain-containing protein [Paraphysoderma sedebokerense]|nr:transmembrane amino acid transporter protein-domain-containing protein [Paraphysoderma sedebokerense]
MGGFAVRDVYKWKEKGILNIFLYFEISFVAINKIFIAAPLLNLILVDEVNRKLQHRRSKSETHLSDLADDAKSTHSSAREIRQPGGFRRFFVKTKAEKEGKPTPPLTRTFIDFLALYGNFAGEWVWDAEEVQEWGDMDHLSPIREEYQDEELAISYNGGGSEQTPLLGSPRSPLSPSSPRRASHIQGTAGDRKVFLLLIKAFIGTGVLFLPSAFKDGGLTFSTVVMVLIAVLTVHGMLLLFETHKTIPGSFGDIAERCYGRKMRLLVLASITLSQTGFCMAYIIFVAQNAQSVVAHLSNCRYNLPLHYFILLQLILYLPLALVRKIKHFAITSLIADVFILGGLCVIGYYDVDRIVTMGMQRVEHIGKGIAVYLGTACYTFEGICLTLPIAQSMKNPSHFPRILSFTMALTTSIYILIASLSYLAYGPQLRTIVLLNLPASPVTTTTHILYILAIMFTWPLVLFPATRILENAVFPAVSGKNDPWQKWQKNFLRSCLVCVLAVGAWGGSRSLSKFVSLIGSFACIPLSFIYPALFHYKASAVTLRQKVSDILLFIFGVVSMLYVTYVTINTWGVEEGGLDGDMCVGVGHPSGSTGI